MAQRLDRRTAGTGAAAPAAGPLDHSGPPGGSAGGASGPGAAPVNGTALAGPAVTEPGGVAGAPPPAARWPRLRARGWRRGGDPAVDAAPVPLASRPAAGPDIELAPHDPLVGYLLSAGGAVDIRTLDLDSPALTALKEGGVALAVPLISSGNLIGLMSLGPRLSERDYTSEDRRLLNALAGYAAPAMRVGQLVREQQAEARDRERLNQELKIAQIIQQQFLPKSVPDLPSWHVAAFYRPARTVGGDFYDFIPLPDGRVMFVVGDVTDKGVPAALVMASTHALLRGAAPRLISPGAVLAQVNDLLCADIPAHMFVTCLALVLDPASGQVEFANAGHDVPYVRTANGVTELRARGMPLGLMPGMAYEEKTFQFQPGDCALLHSDGLAEAHGPDREMFGFPRVSALAGRGVSGEALIDLCLTELGEFTGPEAEQEDDITLVSLERTMSAMYSGGSA